MIESAPILPMDRHSPQPLPEVVFDVLKDIRVSLGPILHHRRNVAMSGMPPGRPLRHLIKTGRFAEAPFGP
jgi:hypothetical protein